MYIWNVIRSPKQYCISNGNPHFLQFSISPFKLLILLFYFHFFSSLVVVIFRFSFMCSFGLSHKCHCRSIHDDFQIQWDRNMSQQPSLPSDNTEQHQQQQSVVTTQPVSSPPPTPNRKVSIASDPVMMENRYDNLAFEPNSKRKTSQVMCSQFTDWVLKIK